MKRPAKRQRDAGSGQFVSAEYAAEHPASTVAETVRQPLAGEQAATFKRGDRVTHPNTGPATVTSGRLGPNGELKVRPDAPHHSGLKVVEVMARRCTKIVEDGRPVASQDDKTP